MLGGGRGVWEGGGGVITCVPSSTLVSTLVSSKGGAQCLDRIGRRKAFVPKAANRKSKTNGHSHVSDTLQRRCWQWV